MFLLPSDPRLKESSEEVNPSLISTEEVQNEIDAMIRTAYGEQGEKNRSVLVGLAAPQVGISKRIILVDVGANGKGDVSNLQEYINPEILWLSDEEEEWYEGCYSTGRVKGIVSRPKAIAIRAYKRDGQKVEETHTGYVARIFQHEVDHLNGKVFVDHIEDDDKLHWVEDTEMGEYRNQEKWRDWPKKCPREKWLKIQSS